MGRSIPLTTNTPETHRVYLNFFLRRSDTLGGEWVVQFSPPSLDRAIGPIRVWKTSDAIRELIQRTPTKMDLAAHQALDVAFEMGRGAIFLDLTSEQYQSLVSTKRVVKRE